MSSQDLVLDPSLRQWVLFPILFVMILVGIIRHYATILLQPGPKKDDDSLAVREQQILAYSTYVRSNSMMISSDSFDIRRTHLVENLRKGAYLKDPQVLVNSAAQNANNMLTDPKGMDNMMSMFKGQIMMVVPQTLMMGWINAFFAGFILMRLPFPLTIRFKSMLQSGVDTSDLDVRWVSSLSWYFLNLMGLQSVYSLILGTGNSAGGIVQTANPAAAMMQPGTDVSKLHLAEAENLQLVKHDYLLEGIEDRIISTYS
jgi:hypothetical protein